MLVLRDWLKDFYGDAIPSLEEIEKLFTFHTFEIEETKKEGDREIIDVKVLPDRGADCHSHRGIARELATLTDVSLAYDPFCEPRTLTPITKHISVSIEDPNLCRRFGMALITGVKVGPSPEWLAARLKALGQRSINNVVDATNYVMLSLGQPLHAYDGDIFPHENGVWKFGVRRARQGEVITTLTNDVYELNPAVQLIVDDSNDVPAGIAGIKGGKYAEVTEKTTTILLEAANFDPSFTRRASQTLKLQTDASKRFENGISPDVIPAALTEVVRVILEIAEGTCEGFVDVYATHATNPRVTVTLPHIQALLGVAVTNAEVADILARLGFDSHATSHGWEVTAPFERTDIQIPADIIAEVGRVYGYEHIASVVPPTVPLAEVNARHVYSERIRTALIELGFSEIVTSSFRNTDTIRLQNALAADKGCLRSSLVSNMHEALDRNMPNLDLLGLSALRMFEIGTVFSKGEDGVAEHMAVALGVRVKQQGYTPKDDALLHEALLQLENVLTVSLHARVEHGVAEFDLTTLLTALPAVTTYEPFKSADVTYRPFSAYPFISRDIALWVPEGVAAETVCVRILTEAGTLATHVRLFDTFSKDGRTSYAFRIIFQSFERTLTDPEVTAIMQNVVTTALKEGWEVR